jgi:hypothetical protein
LGEKEMNLFVAMPFAKEFDDVYTAIRRAAENLSLDTTRVDELYEPGPIIQQIFRGIAESDFVVAEISSKNPNVYYEVGLAHCVRKPTLLLANKEAISGIPFDVRHNRVLVYDKNNISQLEEALKRHFEYFIHHLSPKGSPPPLNEYLHELGSGPQLGREIIRRHVEEVAKEYKLTNAKVIEENFLPEEGYLITVGDAFGEKVVFLIDVNGILRRTKQIH